MNYQTRIEKIQSAVRRYVLSLDASVLQFAQVLNLWQEDETFRVFFIDLLADAPYHAFRFETPPITMTTQSRPFEFVLIDSPWLDRLADPVPFSEHFNKDDSDIVVFENLGGDATLIVPTPQADGSCYGHIASFIRRAPQAQVHALWRQAGSCVSDALSEQPLWLSTAGGGVDWLHVRLDSRPKYYAHEPYRSR